MEKYSGILMMLLLGGGGLVVVVVRDWHKRRTVQKLRAAGRPVRRKDLRNNETDWGLVALIACVLTIYGVALTIPDLAERDFGPLDPLVKWFLNVPD